MSKQNNDYQAPEKNLEQKINYVMSTCKSHLTHQNSENQHEFSESARYSGNLIGKQSWDKYFPAKTLTPIEDEVYVIFKQPMRQKMKYT